MQRNAADRTGCFVARNKHTLSQLSHIAAPWFFLKKPSILLVLFFILQMGQVATKANAANRSLTLYNTHTKETQTITYKRGGRFDAKGLRQMNRFLRDWRRNEHTKMDPNLFDLIWEIYRKTGAKKPVHVVSGYRSPATNNMLRRRSRAVAKQSRHTKGQAMDFYLPGVSVKKIREAGLRLQSGGVGYYPSSRSPFVHIDTGTVRHWPRMTRKQLVRVFPRGNTIHVPRDRKPLKGYQTAKLQVQRRKAEMARSARSVGRFTQVAKAAPSRPSRQQVASLSKSQQQSKPGLLQSLLQRRPKAPPKPDFNNAASKPEQTKPKAPIVLTAIPRPRPAQLSKPIVTAQLDLAGEQTEQSAPTIAPITALPRPRPAVRFVLASASPAIPVPVKDNQPEKVETPTVTEASGSIVEGTAATTTPTAETQEASAGRITVAALPSTALNGPIPQPRTQPTAAIDQQQPASADGTRILATLDNQSTKPEKSDNRFAYAASEDAFIAKLPSGIPRAANRQAPVPRAAERTKVASLPTDGPIAPLPRPAARTAQNEITQTGNALAGLPKAKQARPAQPAPRKQRDQFAKLTFSYGLSGMRHITHVKQATKTASFARLSRPIPSNLRALVSKPYLIIDQGFSHAPVKFASDDRFSGPIFAKMSTRSFN